MPDPLTGTSDPSAPPATQVGASPTPKGSASEPATQFTLSREDLSSVIAEATAPLLAKIEGLENSRQAHKRIAGGAPKPAPKEGQESGSETNEEVLQRQIDALMADKDERAAAEKINRGKTAIESLITAEAFANHDIARQLVEKNITENANGALFYDDGTKATPLEKYVEELKKRPVFQHPSNGDGTGTGNDKVVPKLGDQKLTPEVIGNGLTKDQFAELKAKKLAGKIKL